MDINEINNKVTASNQLKFFIDDLRGARVTLDPLRGMEWWHPRARESGSRRGGLRVNERVEAPELTVLDACAGGK